MRRADGSLHHSQDELWPLQRLGCFFIQLKVMTWCCKGCSGCFGMQHAPGFGECFRATSVASAQRRSACLGGLNWLRCRSSLQRLANAARDGGTRTRSDGRLLGAAGHAGRRPAVAPFPCPCSRGCGCKGKQFFPAGPRPAIAACGWRPSHRSLPGSGGKSSWPRARALCGATPRWLRLGHRAAADPPPRARIRLPGRCSAECCSLPRLSKPTQQFQGGLARFCGAFISHKLWVSGMYSCQSNVSVPSFWWHACWTGILFQPTFDPLSKTNLQTFTNQLQPPTSLARSLGAALVRVAQPCEQLLVSLLGYAVWREDKGRLAILRLHIRF